jgi:hypothetical protein
MADVGEINMQYFKAPLTYEVDGHYYPTNLSVVLGQMASGENAQIKPVSPLEMVELYDQVALGIYGFKTIEASRQAQADRYNESRAQLEKQGFIAA